MKHIFVLKLTFFCQTWIFFLDLRTFLSNFVPTDVNALLLKSYPEDFRPILSWVSSNPILGRNLSTTPAPWFCIPGVSGEFHILVVKKTEEYSHSEGRKVKLPTRVKADDQVFQVKFFFNVSLIQEPAAKTYAQACKVAGTLEVLKEGAETQLGEIGDLANHHYDRCRGNGCSFESKLAFQYWFNEDKLLNGKGFFTSGSTSLLNLVAILTYPGELITLGSGAEEEFNPDRLFDFYDLLEDPKHSDIVLKCGDKQFLCHKVILAAR